MKFTDALKKHRVEGHIPLIADIKCFSPKDGDLMKGRDPAALAVQLEKAGACALSVVTEEKEFHGSMDLLKKICSCVSVPVLRKDFVTCEDDLDETKNAGAQAILLMVSCLGEAKLETLYHAALRKGLTPFVETHTFKEYEFALRLGAGLIGINNRDITVLERDDGTVAHSGSILKRAAGLNRFSPDPPFIITESSLRNGDDVRTALRSGADAALVGTAILSAADPVEKYYSMTRKSAVKICGLMSEADVDVCLENRVDICGFVVQYPVDVRWNLDAQAALKLIRRVKEAKTCIVTGGNSEQVISLAGKLRPDFVQLHYRETMEETEQIAQKLAGDGIGVIRSIPSERSSVESMFGTADPAKLFQMLASSSVTGVLFDTREAGNASSGGGDLLHSFGGEMVQNLGILKNAGKMIMAGGGITQKNAGQVLNTFKPDCLDVMTGAEDPAGLKSGEKIRNITMAVR